MLGPGFGSSYWKKEQMEAGIRGGTQFPDGNTLLFNSEKLILFQVLYPEEETT